MNNIELKLITELKKLVSFRPVTSDQEATLALLKYVVTRTKKLGMQTKFFVVNGYPSLLASTQSLTSFDLLLQAHIDVVPAENDHFTVKRSDDILTGRGVYDMLFATAMYLAVLGRLADEKMLIMKNIGLLLTGDEEIGGYDGVGRLMRNIDAKVCFLPDAGGPCELNTKAKGVLQLAIQVMGVGGHAGRPHEYNNPIIAAAQFVAELSHVFPNNNIEETVCSVSGFQAGNAINQVPPMATISVDIRYISADDPSALFNKVSRIASKFNGTVKELSRDQSYSINITDPYIKQFISLYEELTANKVRLIQATGSSDARFIVAKGIPVIMLRPKGGGMHAEHEWISLASFVQLSEVLHKYILDI